MTAPLADNDKLVGDEIGARDLAGELKGPGTRDLMTGRITLHQKTILMLESFHKQAAATRPWLA